MEFLLQEQDGDQWMFRRDHRIRRTVRSATVPVDPSIQVFAPEIVLLFKAKHPRACDIADFTSALPALSVSARTWLRTALDTAYPDHPWIAALAESTPG